ncbi:MAG: hypothetical protein Q9183_001672 [Haloplaca sp. 2 TL-2023]
MSMDLPSSNMNMDLPPPPTNPYGASYLADITSDLDYPAWEHPLHDYASPILPKDIRQHPVGLPQTTPDNPLQSDRSTPTSSSHSSAQHHRQGSSNSSRSAPHDAALDATQMNNLKIENTTAEPLTNGNLDLNQSLNFGGPSHSPGEFKAETSAGNTMTGMIMPQNVPSPHQQQQPKVQTPKDNYFKSSQSVASAPFGIPSTQTILQPGYGASLRSLESRPGYQSSNHFGSTQGLPYYSPFNDYSAYVTPEHHFKPPSMFNGLPNVEQPNRHYHLTLPNIQDKTRVETQIPMIFALSPMPPNITKLRLPLRTMAKPKLIAKSPRGKSSDTLELEVMPFCASAMKVQRFRDRAFVMARGDDVETDGRSIQSIDPKDGGPINICDGCVQRERKRANRRNENKEKDEDVVWRRSEKERIVVFNDPEISEWKPYTRSSFIETASKKAKGGRRGRKKSEEIIDDPNRMAAFFPEVPFPNQAKQICLMMRITCYCRHQNESEGFQVILTIKDHQGRCLAQQISSPILITDDHKAAGPPNGSKNGSPVEDDFPLYGEMTCPPASTYEGRAGHSMFAFGHSRSATEVASLLRAQPNPHLHRSSTSVQMNPHAVNYPMQQRCATRVPSQYASSYYQSTNPTPRTLSRPVSPSGSKGRNPKRRKASGSIHMDHRPFGNLAMTSIRTAESTQQPQQSASPTSLSAISDPLMMGATAAPVVTNGYNNTGGQEREISGDTDTTIRPYTQGNADIDTTIGPYTQGSIETAQPPLFAPAEPGSAPDLDVFMTPGVSPPTGQQQSGTGMGMNLVEHANQLARSLNNLSEGSMPQSVDPMQASDVVVPKVMKVIPAEGSVSGGTEVTVLGQGFRPGVHVCFGNAVATQTQIWGDNTIICVIPPSSQPGLVSVTVQGIERPASEEHALFQYVDNQASDIYKLALDAFEHRTHGGQYTDAGAHMQSGFNTRSYEDQETLNPQWLDGSMLYQYPKGFDQGPLDESLDESEPDRGRVTNILDLPVDPGSQDMVIREPQVKEKSINQPSMYGPQPYQHQETPNLEPCLLSILDLIDQAESNIPPYYDGCNANGQTMLHLSASLGFDKLAAGLLARGANPDLRDQNGMTAMHMACLHWHFKVLRKLVYARGDPTIRCLLGLCPADMAASKEPEVAAFIGSNNYSQSSLQSGEATPSSYLSRVGTRMSTPAHEWAISRRNSTAYAALPEKEFLEQREANCDAVEYGVCGANSRGGIVEYGVRAALPEKESFPHDSGYDAVEHDNKPFRRNSLCNSMDEKTLLRRNSICDGMPGQQLPRRNSICKIVPDSEPVPPSYTDIYPPRGSVTDLKKEAFARAVGDALLREKCALLDERCAQLQGEGRFGATARMVIGWKNDWKLYCVWSGLLGEE